MVKVEPLGIGRLAHALPPRQQLLNHPLSLLGGELSHRGHVPGFRFDVNCDGLTRPRAWNRNPAIRFYSNGESSHDLFQHSDLLATEQNARVTEANHQDRTTIRRG
jgi:hypothetical protein